MFDISDINECKISNPCVNGKCKNEGGTFSCECLEGYTSVNATFCGKEQTAGPSTALLVSLPLGTFQSPAIYWSTDTNFLSLLYYYSTKAMTLLRFNVE